jgi:hypothetical protein
MRSKKTLLKPSLILTIAALGFFGGVVFAAPPPKNTPHPCSVAVGDRIGDSILSDGGGIYTDGVNADARLWDMKNGIADHLYFQAGGARKVSLSIPGVTDGIQTCATGTFKPNVNASGYQFYNDLPVGSSTADVGQNFGGTIGCNFGIAGRDAYNVTYESQCIVITHGDYGNTSSDPLKWTVTADAGCTASVTKVLSRRVVAQWVGQDVPFQLTATELP